MDEEENGEEDVVFSSRLKSVLLNAPKELSHAMFDFASSAFALTTTRYAISVPRSWRIARSAALRSTAARPLPCASGAT